MYACFLSKEVFAQGDICFMRSHVTTASSKLSYTCSKSVTTQVAYHFIMTICWSQKLRKQLSNRHFFSCEMKEENCKKLLRLTEHRSHTLNRPPLFVRGRLSRIVGDNANHFDSIARRDQRCRHSVVRVATNEFLIIYKIHNTFDASASSLTCNKILPITHRRSIFDFVMLNYSLFKNSLSNLIDCFSSRFFS